MFGTKFIKFITHEIVSLIGTNAHYYNRKEFLPKQCLGKYLLNLLGDWPHVYIVQVK